jgi:hypothetical protein
MSVKQPTIHTHTIVTHLLNTALNGEKYVTKKESLDNVNKRFTTTPEYAKLDKEYKAVEYNSGENTKANKALKELDALAVTLEAGTAEATATVATALNFKAPTRNADRAVAAELKTQKDALTAKIEGFKKQAAERDALKKAMDVQHREFVAADKAAYTAWRAEMIEVHQAEVSTKDKKLKYANTIEMLRDQLAAVAKDRQEVFTELIDVDASKPGSIRLSKSHKIVLHLMEYATTEYFRQAQVTHGARYGSLVADNRAADAEKPILPTTLTAADLVESDFSGSRFSFLLDTEYVRSLRSLGSNMSVSSQLAEFSQAADSKITADVADYIKKQKIDASPELVALVAALVTDLCHKLGVCAKNVLATHGSITTLKPEIFDNILEPFFILRGQDYAPVREELHALWA